MRNLLPPAPSSFGGEGALFHKLRSMMFPCGMQTKHKHPPTPKEEGLGEEALRVERIISPSPPVVVPPNPLHTVIPCTAFHR